jgi:hypothetical protein
MELVVAINDGVNTEVALFTPEVYGKSFAEAEYSVEGIYTYGDGGEAATPGYIFRMASCARFTGFTGRARRRRNRRARGITPQPGDTFTILELWYDLDAQGKISQAVRQEGGTLTFGDQPFEWMDLDAAAGEYLVGFLVEDLDGNPTAVYEPVTVR